MTKLYSKILWLNILGVIILLIVTSSQANTSAINATIKVSVCGNFIAEDPEECDNYDFNSGSCVSFGFDSGSLTCLVDCTIDTANCVNDEDDGGGSGGGGSSSSSSSNSSNSSNQITGVTISGRAYPLSDVTILKDGQLAAMTIAGPDANFSVSLTGLSAGNYNFTVYGTDKNKINSENFNFNIYVTTGTVTSISGIFITPSIGSDKNTVKHGDNIVFFGQSLALATVTIKVNSATELFSQVSTDSSGAYLYTLDSSVLEVGQHSARAKTVLTSVASEYGRALNFSVSETGEPIEETEVAPIKGDGNNDGKVNLVDFSIAAYWYQQPSPPATVDLNNDGAVNLVDFSILAYYWTG